MPMGCLREWVEHFYENVWIHRARQGLGGLSPLAAAEAAIGAIWPFERG